jgi:acyl-CoA dehydrogenase
MDFKLTEEQIEYRQLAQDFAVREMKLLAERIDKQHEEPRKVHVKMFEAGLMNVQVPENLGGLGLSLWNACLVAEGLAYGCSGTAAAAEFNALAQLPLLHAGTDEQKELWLPSLSERLTYVGVSLSGFFDKRERIKAHRQGDHWLLNGAGLILNGAQCQWLVLPIADGEQTRFAVVKTGGLGLTFTGQPYSVGRKAQSMHMVVLSDVCVAEGNVVSADDRQIDAIQGSARTILAAGMIGVAQAAFESAKKYANERQTFGKPISQHQAVSFILADMIKDIEAARLLTYKSAVLVENRQRSLQAASTALAFAAEMVTRVTIDAVQVFGGYGYSKEYPVEKLMRDAKSYQCLIPPVYIECNQLGKALLAV